MGRFEWLKTDEDARRFQRSGELSKWTDHDVADFLDALLIKMHEANEECHIMGVAVVGGKAPRTPLVIVAQTAMKNAAVGLGLSNPKVFYAHLNECFGAIVERVVGGGSDELATTLYNQLVDFVLATKDLPRAS